MLVRAQMKVRANVTGSELRCGRGMKFKSSVRELEEDELHNGYGGRSS